MRVLDAQYILSNYRHYLTEHVARKYLFLIEVFNVLAYAGKETSFPFLFQNNCKHRSRCFSSPYRPNCMDVLDFDRIHSLLHARLAKSMANK